MAMIPGTKTTHDKITETALPVGSGVLLRTPSPPATDPAGFSEAGSAAPKEAAAGRLFRVRLLKGYFPAGHYVVIRNGQPVAVTSPPSSAMTITDKLEADSVVELPIEEARACVAKGIAERADGIGF